MKKILVVLTLMAGGMILIFSCSKNESVNNDNGSVNSNNECSTCKEGELLALKILSFKEKLQIAKENPKSGEIITMEEAIENMELLINASHGFPFGDYSERKTDIVSFQMPADADGNVLMTDVTAAYDEMISQVRDAYINTGFEEKGLIIVTLFYDPENKDNETVNATVTTGKSGEKDPEDFDCWYYGEDLGMCDGTYYMEMDGGDAIAEVIIENNPLNGYIDCPGPNFHIVLDPQPVLTLEGNEYQNGSGEYLIFFYPDDDGNGFTNEEKKLYSDDMNFYYDNEYEVIYDLVPDEHNYLFPDYVLVNCVIDGEYVTISGIETLHHQNKLTYAERYWVEDDIMPLPDPIY